MARQPQARGRVAALLLLLAFARLATAGGENVASMNPPVIRDDDPNTPTTYEWAIEGAWPLSDDADALAKAYAAEDVVYVDVPAPGEKKLLVLGVWGCGCALGLCLCFGAVPLPEAVPVCGCAACAPQLGLRRGGGGIVEGDRGEEVASVR